MLLGLRTSFSYRLLRGRNLAWLFYNHQVRNQPTCNRTSQLKHFSQCYMPHEMALRMSLYNIAQPVGAMLSGAMQGALSTNLEGSLGRSGWRWAFIINVSLFIMCQILPCETYSDISGHLHHFRRPGRFHPSAWLCKCATTGMVKCLLIQNI
jgi:hypothetical protein